MPLNLQAPSALGYFQQLLAQAEPFPLLEAASCLGQDVQPDLDVQDVLLQVDVLAERLRKLVPWGAGALPRTQMLNSFFYERLGFAANANDFANPDNSYIHRVLQTRRGIPISLAALWMELAWGIGLQVSGISFPGHFLVKVQLPEGVLVQDPLTGQALGQAQLYEWLEPYQERWGMSQEDMAPLHLFLQPATGHDIVERMLRNLQVVYTQNEHWPKLLPVLDRLLLVRPQDSTLYRDRGMLLAQLGRRAAALQDLQTYVRTAQAATDLPLVEARIELLRTAF